MFKDAVHLTRNDEFYLVTNTEATKASYVSGIQFKRLTQSSCKKTKLILKVTLCLTNVLKDHGQNKPYKVFGIM